MKYFLTVFYICLLSFNVFAQELWNGFSLDMTKEEIIQKSKLDLNAVVTHDGITYFTIFAWNKEHLNSQYWFGYDPNSIRIYSKLPSYKQPKYGYEKGENIIFFFDKTNKLFAIQVYWALTFKEFLPLITKQYGNYKEVILEEKKDWQGNLVDREKLYKWETNDKIIYVGDWQENDYLPMTIISKPVIQSLVSEYKNEVAEKERVRKLEEESRKKAASSGVKF